MMRLRLILNSDRTVGARRLVVGADRIGRVAIWQGSGWALASDPKRTIHDADAIGEIDLSE